MEEETDPIGTELRKLVRMAYEEADKDPKAATIRLVNEVVGDEDLRYRVLHVGCYHYVSEEIRRRRWEATKEASPTLRNRQPRKVSRALVEKLTNRTRRYFLMTDFTLPGGMVLGVATRVDLLAAVDLWKRNEEGNARNRRFATHILQHLTAGKTVSDMFNEGQLADFMEQAVKGEDPIAVKEEKPKKGRIAK